MRRAAEELGSLVGFRLEDNMVREVLRVRAEYGSAIERVRTLLRGSDPVPLGSTHENLLAWLPPVAMSIDGLRRATEAVNTLHHELEERVERGIGVTKKGAPKILGILPSHHSDPRLEQLINELGMAVVGVDFELRRPQAAGLGETDDPYTRPRSS